MDELTAPNFPADTLAGSVEGSLEAVQTGASPGITDVRIQNARGEQTGFQDDRLGSSAFLAASPSF